MSVISRGMGTLGFLKVKGRAMISDGTVDWSAVIKVMDVETDVQFDGSQGSFASQHREIEAYESGFFDQLDGDLRAAPCHGITRTGEVAMLWLEDLSDSVPHPWDRDEFLMSARATGVFNGSWPESRAPEGEWLERGFMTNRPMFWSGNPRINSIAEPENKQIAAELGALSGVATIDQMPSEFVEVANSLTGLPRVVSHNDLHSRNAFFRNEESGPVIYLIDWASVGLGPVGLDGGTLAGGGLLWTEKEALLSAEIEEQMFGEYLRGLTDSGYSYKRDQVRLGYLSNILVYMTVHLMVVADMESQSAKRLATNRFGVTGEEFLNQLAFRLRTFKPLFDEAVALARQLG